MKKSIPVCLLCCAGLFWFAGCSIQKFALRQVADMMSGEMGASAFAGDEDLELTGDALPFALKIYEIILEQEPEHQGMLLTAGMGFIGYANIYVLTPAEMLSYEENDREQYMRGRAKKLYLRGRDYVLRALEAGHPGIMEILAGSYQNGESKKLIHEALAEMSEEDVPYLYWTAVGWFGALGADMFDMNLTLDAPKAVAMIDRAYVLEPDYGGGLIHEFYISYYASLPPGMIEGSREKALYHFDRAVELSGGKNPMPYVSLATTLHITEQNVQEFQRLLTDALKIDPEENPDNKMAVVHAQRKAKWYLDRMEDYFLIDMEEVESWE